MKTVYLLILTVFLTVLSGCNQSDGPGAYQDRAPTHNATPTTLNFTSGGTPAEGAEPNTYNATQTTPNTYNATQTTPNSYSATQTTPNTYSPGTNVRDYSKPN